MKQIVNKQLAQLHAKLQPQIKQLTTRWEQLQPRERWLIIGMVVFVVCSMLYLSIDSLTKYKTSLKREVVSLNEFVLYANQSAHAFKSINKLENKRFTMPNLEQVKSDVTQIVSVDNASVNLQDGQLVINIQEAKFNQIMLLLEQLRRSYGLFPEQVTITRHAKDGFVSFSALFWVS